MTARWCERCGYFAAGAGAVDATDGYLLGAIVCFIGAFGFALLSLVSRTRV